jgi:hypothetical protein
VAGFRLDFHSNKVENIEQPSSSDITNRTEILSSDNNDSNEESLTKLLKPPVQQQQNGSNNDDLPFFLSETIAHKAAKNAQNRTTFNVNHSMSRFLLNSPSIPEKEILITDNYDNNNEITKISRPNRISLLASSKTFHSFEDQNFIKSTTDTFSNNTNSLIHSNNKRNSTIIFNTISSSRSNRIKRNTTDGGLFTPQSEKSIMFPSLLSPSTSSCSSFNTISSSRRYNELEYKGNFNVTIKKEKNGCFSF